MVLSYHCRPMYQSLRPFSDYHVHLICRDQESKSATAIPQPGPWQVMGRGRLRVDLH